MPNDGLHQLGVTAASKDLALNSMLRCGEGTPEGDAIERVQPKGRFPKIIAKVGESPPQDADPEELE